MKNLGLLTCFVFVFAILPPSDNAISQPARIESPTAIAARDELKRIDELKKELNDNFNELSSLMDASQPGSEIAEHYTTLALLNYNAGAKLKHLEDLDMLVKIFNGGRCADATADLIALRAKASDSDFEMAIDLLNNSISRMSDRAALITVNKLRDQAKAVRDLWAKHKK